MLFIKQLVEAKHVGAISQSSKFLAQKIVEISKLDKAKVIVELGPGMGAITKHILKAAPKDSTFLTVEINEKFINYLNQKYPEVEHIHESISNLKSILSKNKIDHVDVIISGIPFVGFKKEECEKFFSEINEVMNEGSRLILFTYSPVRFSSYFKYFKKVSINYVLLNIPPAFVLCLKKKQ